MRNEMGKINLSRELIDSSYILVNDICSSLKISRDVMPDSESINHALMSLPREINKIPHKFRDKDIAKMCVAVSVGLYDDAILRIWNSVMKELKNKIGYYGIEMIKHVAGENYNDNFLESIKDSQLLVLARQLNIISEQGFYFLDQCRDIRNNASIAHPTEIEINEMEMLTFINRCNIHGLQDDYETKGIDMKLFISLLKEKDIKDDQFDILVEQLAATFESQRDLIWNILYSHATNEENSTQLRSNSIYVSESLSKLSIISEKVEASMLEKHNTFRLKGEEKKVVLSRFFLEKIGRINNIDESEKIGLLNKAIKELNLSHVETNNFYNETPFAERLSQLCGRFNPVPELVLESLVKVALQCYLGNDYGVCWSAQAYYLSVLTELSPKGMELLLKLPLENDSFSQQIKNPTKKNRYKDLLMEINKNVLTSKQKRLYEDYLV